MGRQECSDRLRHALIGKEPQDSVGLLLGCIELDRELDRRGYPRVIGVQLEYEQFSKRDHLLDARSVDLNFSFAEGANADARFRGALYKCWFEISPHEECDHRARAYVAVAENTAVAA